MRQDGVEVRGITQPDGTAEFCEVFFTDARCPKDNVVGGVNNGWKVANSTLAFERGQSATTGYRRFEEEYRQMVAVARENGAIDDPLIRQRLVEYYTKIQILRVNGLRSLSATVSGAKDMGVIALGATNKMFWSEMHKAAMELALDIFGAASMLVDTGPDTGSWPGALRDKRREGYPVSPMMSSFFFSRSETIWGGTSQIQRNIVGERVLGLPKEPRPGLIGLHQPETHLAYSRREMTETKETSRATPWDEMRDGDGDPRPAAEEVLAVIERLGVEELHARQATAATDILTMGITFTVYSDGTGIDRAWPFDVIPRVIEANEWARVERGLVQRLAALNRFIDDVYNERRIVADGVFPADLLDDSANYRPECQGVHPKFGVWAHISGSDLVRDADGTMYVLEDNLRVPSGVSYVIENRAVAKRAFPELFARLTIAPVDAYTDELNKLLVSLAPDGVGDPSIAVLTPGHLQLRLLRALLPRPADGRHARRGR